MRRTSRIKVRRRGCSDGGTEEECHIGLFCGPYSVLSHPHEYDGILVRLDKVQVYKNLYC